MESTKHYVRGYFIVDLLSNVDIMYDLFVKDLLDERIKQSIEFFEHFTIHSPTYDHVQGDHHFLQELYHVPFFIRMVVFNALFSFKIFRIARIVQIADATMDLMLLKLVEQHYVSLSRWIFIEIKLLRNLLYMVAIVNVINGFWMHFAHYNHLNILAGLYAQLGNEENHASFQGLQNYPKLWMDEIYYICTLVSTVGYGNNASLPDVDGHANDFVLLTLLKLFGLIIF